MNWDWDKFYQRAYDWIIVTGPKIVAALIILLIGFWLIRLFSKGLRKTMERKRFNPSLRYFLQNLIVITLQILLIVFALQILGVQLTFFTAIVAGLSVAAGLALSGTLQNFVSGILILLNRPYKVGDNIVVQNNEGKVQSIQLFYTIIVTYDNKTIIVPNGQLSNNLTINLSKQGNRRMDIDMKFSFGIPYEDVKRVVLQTLEKMPKVQSDPAPKIGITAFEADKYTVTIKAWTVAKGFRDTLMETNEAIVHNLRENGVKLPGMT